MSTDKAESSDSNETVIAKEDTEHLNMEQLTEQELGASGGVRPKTFTEKGQLYDLETLVKKFNALKTLSTNLSQMVFNKDPNERIHKAYSKWMESYEQFLDHHQRHLSKLKEDEKETYLLTHDQRETFLANIKTAVLNYLATKEIVPQETVISNRTSVSSKKLETEEKRIELEMKRKALKRKTEIEMARIALKMQEEELELETDIAVADAKAKVYDKYEKSSEIDTVPLKLELIKTEKSETKVQNSKPDINHDMKLNPSARKFIPARQETKDYSDMLNFPLSDYPKPIKTQNVENEKRPIYMVNINDNLHTQAVESMVKHLRKPTPEVRKFSGNPLEYRKFLRQFHAKVVINCDNDDEKMNYLEQLTFGEANRVVSGYSHLSGERAYQASINALEERYGDVEVIASAFIKKALEWPTIKNGDTKSLDEFALFLTECLNGTESIQASNVLEYSENIKRLMGKLPFYLHDRWRNVVFRIKESRKTVKFKDFVDFVKAEAKKANDPTYGNSAVSCSQKEQKAQDKNQRRDHQKLVHTAFEIQSVPQTIMKCSYCESDLHTLDNCKAILTKSLQDRYVHFKSKGLCYGCLKHGHMTKMCRNRLTCAICGRKHPTLLHDESRMNVSNRTFGKQDSREKDLKNPVCASIPVVQTDTGAGVRQGANDRDVSCAMAIIPVRIKLKSKPFSIVTYAFFDSGSSVSFCTESLMLQLNGSGKKSQITLNTMGNPYKMTTYALNGVQVCDLNMEHVVDLPRIYTKEDMPVSREHIYHHKMKYRNGLTYLKYTYLK